MIRILHIVLLLFLVALHAGAQQDETVYRLEIGGGIGGGFHASDLKGKAGIAGMALARFPLNPRMAIKTQFSYMQLKGNTDGLKEFYPANPSTGGTDHLSYQVSNGIYDLSALYELHFLPYGFIRGYQGYCRLVPFIQGGFGLTYGPAGKAFTANVPLGLGLKYKVGERLNLGLDWLVHFSLSDKLDGLEAPLGIKSSGFRNKDHYSTLSVTLTYDLNPRCPTCNRD